MNQIKILVIFLLIVFVNMQDGFVFATETLSEQISINFSSISVKELLQLLTEYSGKSVVISEKVSGKININLRKTSWKEALDTVLQLQGLAKRETANSIIIAPASEFDKNEQLALKTITFNLRHTSADSISKILRPSGVLSQYSKVGTEARTNMLVVSDTGEKIDILKNLLKQIDIPVKQVLIEAKIVSADENFLRDLGLELGTTQSEAIKKHESDIFSSGFYGGKFNFAIAKLNNKTLLDLELTALESEGRGKVISSPKLLTTDRQAAYIESGAEIPYQEKTKKGDTSVAFKKAVLSLKVTPEVVAENAVNLLLQLNQDKVSQLTVKGVPAIDTRKIQTQVLVHNGETIVLGGIYEWGKSEHITGVPVLWKIPLIGRLFCKQEIKLERKELLMFVTPHIIQ